MTEGNADFHRLRFRRISRAVEAQRGMPAHEFKLRLRTRMVEAGEDYMQAEDWDRAARLYAGELGVRLDGV